MYKAKGSRRDDIVRLAHSRQPDELCKRKKAFVLNVDSLSTAITLSAPIPDLSNPDRVLDAVSPSCDLRPVDRAEPKLLTDRNVSPTV